MSTHFNLGPPRHIFKLSFRVPYFKNINNLLSPCTFLTLIHFDLIFHYTFKVNRHYVIDKILPTERQTYEHLTKY